MYPGQPSVRAFTANGVVLIHFAYGQGGSSAIATYTLPDASHSVRTTVLNDYVDRSSVLNREGARSVGAG